MDVKKRVACVNCASTNNYPLDAGEKKVVCGRCKATLPRPGTVVEPSEDQAQMLMQSSSLPLLVDFFSPTCAPCHMMNPILENLAARRAGEVMVVKINVDLNPQLASVFGIQGVPTFVIIHKGTERDRMSGAISEADFSLWVASRV